MLPGPVPGGELDPASIDTYDHGGGSTEQD
jgi:hypothetical protein